MIDDDPTTRWYQRKLLEDLSKNTRQPVLAEMAREILAGRLTTRQAMSSDAYMSALGAAARPAVARFQQMSPDEVAAAEREGRVAAEQLKAEEEQREARRLAAEQRARLRRTRDPVDDEPTGSIMVNGAHGTSAGNASNANPALPRSVRERARRSPPPRI